MRSARQAKVWSAMIPVVFGGGSTHNGDGDGGQGKGVADDAGHAEPRAFIVACAFHFAERWWSD